MEKKAAIKDIVANLDTIEKLPKNKNLIDSTSILMHWPSKSNWRQDYTFCQRFLMMKILYR